MKNVVVFSVLALIFATPSASLPRQETDLRVVRAVAPPLDPVLAELAGDVRVVVTAAVLPSGEVHNAILNRQQTDLKTLPEESTRSDQFAKAARKWRFEPLEHPRTIEIVFDYKIMPADTPVDEAGTVFIPPLTIELRGIKSPPHRSHR